MLMMLMKSTDFIISSIPLLFKLSCGLSSIVYCAFSKNISFIIISKPGDNELHLITLPVSEKVHRSILSSLDEGPAAVVQIVLAPGLYRRLTPIRFDEVNSTGDVTVLCRMKAITERTSKSRNDINNIKESFNDHDLGN